MKPETIFNALVDSHYQLIHHWNEYGHNKRYRQYHAFRDRVLRMESNLVIQMRNHEREKELLELLRRAHTALMCYMVSHGTPMTELIDELAKELEDVT